MAKRRKPAKVLDTIWEISDDLWTLIEPILLEDCPPREGPGRKRIDWRAAINGIIYRMRSGCQWNHLPKQFGDDSSVHRWFQRWNKNGVMEKIWSKLASACDELDGANWDWQSADGSLAKARFGGIKLAPIPQIVPRMARRRACSSKSKEAPWPWSSKQRTSMIPSC